MEETQWEHRRVVQLRRSDGFVASSPPGHFTPAGYLFCSLFKLYSSSFRCLQTLPAFPHAEGRIAASLQNQKKRMVLLDIETWKKILQRQKVWLSHW